MSKKKKRIRYFEEKKKKKKKRLLQKKILAEEKEEAAIPKKNRRTLVRQHFEMRPVLVEFNTAFPNLMNYFSHSLSLKTWKLSDMHVRLRSHRSRLFGYTVYVFEGTRILEIKHYNFLIPDHIGGHYSKSSYRRV